MKAAAKFKFLHIGFTLWKLVIENIQTWDTKFKSREVLLDSLLSPSFLRVLVKNVSNVKA
jgi:hypothetical protein